MKKIVTFIISVVISFNVYAQQQQADAIAYIEGGKLGFYELSTQENYPNVWTIGSLPHKLYFYNNNLFVVCSGGFTEGDTKLVIINEYLFSDYLINRDSSVFENGATIIPLEQFGNAWDIVAVDDTTVAVSLAAAGKLAIVNFSTGNVSETISENIIGNPQGMCDINDEYLAIALADWGMGSNGKSVAVFNKNTRQVERNIELRTNVVDVKKLYDGNLLAVTWGTWTGAENYGTVSLINPDTWNVEQTLFPGDSAKVYKTVQMDGRYVHLNAYASDFSTITAVLDLQSFTDTTVTEGFWANHFIGKINDLLLAQQATGVVLYTPAGDSVAAIPMIYPTDIAGINCPPIGVEEDGLSIDKFELKQNYPNPFNPATIISYTLPEERNVTLKVYDILGKEVAELVNAKQAQGKHEVQFNASNLSSGVYFYKLQSGEFISIKKMILAK